MCQIFDKVADSATDHCEIQEQGLIYVDPIRKGSIVYRVGSCCESSHGLVETRISDKSQDLGLYAP